MTGRWENEPFLFHEGGRGMQKKLNLFPLCNSP